MTTTFTLSLFLSIILLITVASTSEVEVIEQVVQIHLLRPQSGAGGYRVPQIDCLSWRLAVETNNLQHWRSVPMDCANYVGHYMLGKQYRHDCEVVADAAIEYAKTVKLPRDGRNVWVFDIDETTLSNLPYYARSDVAFGAIPYNSTRFNAWVAEAKAPAIPAALRLYNTVLSLGIKPVFLTGSREAVRQARIVNLKKAGYTSWLKLILKDQNDIRAAVPYKSGKRSELVEAGYRIIGNVGDQWSDIIGDNAGSRTFKFPDPMYYIG